MVFLIFAEIARKVELIKITNENILKYLYVLNFLLTPYLNLPLFKEII